MAPIKQCKPRSREEDFYGCVCKGFVLVLILLCSTKCSFLFCNHFAEEERAGCFTLIVFLMSCDIKCSIALPHSAMGWSEFCDCSISWTYFLTLFAI